MKEISKRVFIIKSSKRTERRQIKIAVNGSMLDEKPTGVGVYTYNLINSFTNSCNNDDQYSITVFTPSKSFLTRKIMLVKLPDFLQSSKYGKFAALTRFLWNTFSYPIWAKNFDVTISPTTHGSFHLKNQIITIHDLLSLKYDNISFHQRLYFRYLLPFMIRKAKFIVAVSESTKKDIIHFFNCPDSKVKVIYNGYDSEKYFTSLAESCFVEKKYSIKNYFLAIGPTYPHKNFIFLLDAYNKLNLAEKSKHPLAIAGGKEPYLSQIKKYVSDNQLSEYVHFLGYVPDNYMAAMYREAFALVYPSLYEGFGFPTLEAMACGCPVLASEVSSIPEVCGDAALYFNPADPASLLNAMKQILNEPLTVNSLKHKGPARAKHFSWEKTAKSYQHLINTHFLNPSIPYHA